MDSHTVHTLRIALYPGLALTQLIFLGLGIGLFLLLFRRRTPLRLGLTLAGLHLAALLAILLIAAMKNDLAWIAASFLDFPAVTLFPRFEGLVSMPFFFLLAGTCQHFLAGVILFKVFHFLRRRKTETMAAAVLLAAAQVHAAGPLTHCEMGRRAWENHLIQEEAMLPGISDFWKDDACRAAFYSGCFFPDTLQDGVNDTAAENAHWKDFQVAYLDWLVEKLPPPWNDDNKQRIAFFFGALCHAAADIPWHFDADENKSLMSAGFARDGIQDFADQACEIYSWRLFDLGGFDVARQFYWPEQDILEVFQREGVPVTADEIHRGCANQTEICALLRRVSPLAYPVYQWKWPWLRAHYGEYYYGGLDCGGAVSAACIRYAYSRLMGWHLYQNVYLRNVLFPEGDPHRPIKDTKISSYPSAPTEEDREHLLLSRSEEGSTEVCLQLNAPLPGANAFTRAELWLYLAHPVLRTTGVGVHAVDDTGNIAPACAAQYTFSAGDAPGWRCWDLTALAKTWTKTAILQVTIEGRGGRCTLYSGNALRTQQDGFGGSAAAFHPLFIFK